MLSSCEVLDSWKVQSTARTSYALSTFKLVLHVFTSSFSSATLSTFKLVLFTSSSSLATWGPALEITYRGFGGFHFLGESFFHEKMEETAVGWSVLLPASVLWKSESLKCLEQTLVCQDILKWRPTSLRTARIHAANRSLFFGNLWKDIFQSSSRWTFFVQFGTQQFYGILFTEQTQLALMTSFSCNSPQLLTVGGHFGIRCLGWLREIDPAFNTVT